MIRTIFFDLDGTILPIDTNTFMHDYFAALASFSAQTGQDVRFILKAIKTGILGMISGDPETTVAARYWQAFLNQVDPVACDWTDLFERFYSEAFPLLKGDVKPDENMIAALDEARKRGYRIVLATNPLFPADAVHCRLGWANVDPSIFEYISTYDNSHFTKPDPRYYQELLDTLDLQGSETLMVGNDLTEDGAARSCGCDLYLVENNLMLPEGVGMEALEDINHGSSADLLAFIKELPQIQ